MPVHESLSTPYQSVMLSMTVGLGMCGFAGPAKRLNSHPTKLLEAAHA
jgi:hypothetical protein